MEIFWRYRGRRNELKGPFVNFVTEDESRDATRLSGALPRGGNVFASLAYRFHNRLNQRVCRKRLVKIRDAAQLRGLFLDRIVIEIGHEDNRKPEASCCKLAPELYPGDVAKLDVDHQTIRAARPCHVEERLRGLIGVYGIAKSR